MTANIDIITGTRENVLAIPTRAVIARDGMKKVRLIGNDNVIREVPVVTGLRGSKGTIEIVEGIREGDKVITFLEEK